jgi:hypothetical protein
VCHLSDIACRVGALHPDPERALVHAFRQRQSSGGR